MDRWNLRLDAALIVLAVAVFGPIIGQLTAQPISRLSFTGAVYDGHTVNLDGYDLGVDRADYHGELRSDKAPFQPLYAIPFYAAARVVGAESARVFRVDDNLTLWWITLWSATIPCALLLILMRRLALPLGRTEALVASLAITFGTPIATWAVQLYGHVFAALLGFAAWFVLRRNARVSGALLGGALAGFAVATEYPCFIIAAVLAGYLFVRHRRRVLPYLIGLVPGALLVTGYQWIAFGSPLRTPYSTKTTNVPRVDGLGLPSPRNVLSILAGGRGLLFTAPVALVAVGAAIALARRRSPHRDDAIIALIIFGAFVVMASAGSPYGGESPAPRYVIPALPFLVVPLAAVVRDWKRLISITAIWGFVVAMLPALTYPLVESRGIPINEYFEDFRDGLIAGNVWRMLFGRTAGWIVYGLCIAGAAFWVWTIARGADTPSENTPVSAETPT